MRRRSWARKMEAAAYGLFRPSTLFTGSAPPPNKPVTEWTLPELLTDTARVGLIQLHGIISQPIKLRQSKDDPPLTVEELKLQRLVGDLALGTHKLLARVAENEMRGRQRQDLIEVLKERIVEAQQLTAKGG